MQIGDELKVFLNPAEYVFEPADHHGYVISSELPDFSKINSLNFDKKNPENFFILDFLNRKEMNSHKKGQLLSNLKIDRIENKLKG